MRMLDMLRAMDAYVGDQDGGGAVSEPRCAIAGCDEWPVTTCVCCNRDVCSGDITGTMGFTGATVDDLGPGICSDCLFTCAGGMACQVVTHA